jgi:hypothetical protein
MIDKDCAADRELLYEYLWLILIPLCQSFGLTVLSVQVRRSWSKGFHVYIAIDPPVDPELAIRMQFLAGDDALRVRLCRLRLQAGFEEFNKLWWYPHRRMRTIYRNITVPAGTRKEERKEK